jgi:P-aminobenzoate N-oxygenase AurF
VTELILNSCLNARLSWRYEPLLDRVQALYQRGKSAQWNADSDIPWAAGAEFGAPLPDDSRYAVAAFERSPLAAAGRGAWDAFRWQFQAWMVSQFLHGEQGAMLAAARLVETVPQIESKSFAATQVFDEARHVEVFSRYLSEYIPARYEVSEPLAALLTDSLTDSRWDITALGVQIMVEALALAAFRLADTTFHDDLIRTICRLVARDEARHISYGVLVLQPAYRELSGAELAEREEFVLQAAQLMSRRFLLTDIWERLGVDVAAGAEFARTDQLMIKYRQAVFSKIVSSLSGVGLMTERVRAGLAALGLLEFAHGRALASGQHGPLKGLTR